jgi:hypothetical protein
MSFFSWFDMMGFPHWMMVFGCVLSLIGFVGFAFKKNQYIGTRRSLSSE